MGHPRRRFEHNDVILVTNRLARGLPFVPNRYLNRIIKGVIARAQDRHPGIILCALDFLQNHYHAIVVIKCERGPRNSVDALKDCLLLVFCCLGSAVTKLRRIAYLLGVAKPSPGSLATTAGKRS